VGILPIDTSPVLERRRLFLGRDRPQNVILILARAEFHLSWLKNLGSPHIRSYRSLSFPPCRMRPFLSLPPTLGPLTLTQSCIVFLFL
jgi:hypothetical protein